MKHEEKKKDIEGGEREGRWVEKWNIPLEVLLSMYVHATVQVQLRGTLIRTIRKKYVGGFETRYEIIIVK